MFRITCGCLIVFLVAAADAQGRPSPPQLHLSVAVESNVSARADFPVTLTLKFAADGSAIRSDDIEFYLLAEDGSEVAQGLFIPIEVPQITEPKDHQVTLAMKLRWDPYVSVKVPVDKRYQLVVICKTKYGHVAGSVWFRRGA